VLNVRRRACLGVTPTSENKYFSAIRCEARRERPQQKVMFPLALGTGSRLGVAVADAARWGGHPAGAWPARPSGCRCSPNPCTVAVLKPWWKGVSHGCCSCRHAHHAVVVVVWCDSGVVHTPYRQRPNGQTSLRPDPGEWLSSSSLGTRVVHDVFLGRKVPMKLRGGHADTRRPGCTRTTKMVEFS
jgi:hypothetical protein